MSEPKRAQDVRTSEAADESESYAERQRFLLSALAPKPKNDTEAAEGTRSDVEAVAGMKEGLSFEEAIKVAPNFRNLLDLFNFAKECEKAKLVTLGHHGRSRWYAVPHPEAENQKASADLAYAIEDNRRKLVREMHQETKKKRPRGKGRRSDRPPKKEGDSDRPQAAAEPAEFNIEETLKQIPNTNDRRPLGQSLEKCEEAGICTIERDKRGVMVVLPIEGVEGSVELAKAYNKQFDAIAEKDKVAKLEKHVQWAVKFMEEARNTPDLRKIIEEELPHMVFIKDGKGKFDWTVHTIKGAPKTYEKVVEEAYRIKEELREKAREEGRARKEKVREEKKAGMAPIDIIKQALDGGRLTNPKEITDEAVLKQYADWLEEADQLEVIDLGEDGWAVKEKAGTTGNERHIALINIRRGELAIQNIRKEVKKTFQKGQGKPGGQGKQGRRRKGGRQGGKGKQRRRRR